MTVRRPFQGIVFCALAATAFFAGRLPAASTEFAETVQSPEAVYTGKGTVVSRAPIQLTASAACGGGSNSCSATAYTVRKRHRLELKNVSCHFTVRSPGTVEFAAVAFKIGSVPVQDWFVPVKIGESGGFQRFAFSTDTFIFGNAGAKLIVGVGATDEVSNMNCTIVGELAKLR